MAEKVIIDKSKLTAIGDAIRSKTGSSATLTVDEMANEISTLGGESATIKTKGGWQGTTVPNNAYVENVYFNTNLSVEEVVNIVNKADLTYSTHPYGFEMSLILVNSDTDNENMTVSLSFAKIGNFIALFDFITMNIYFHNVTDETIKAQFGISYEAGWNPEFNGIIKVNSQVYSTYTEDGVVREVGLQNDKLSSLFSTTSFEAKGTPLPPSGYLENVYFNVNGPSPDVCDGFISVPQLTV